MKFMFLFSLLERKIMEIYPTEKYENSLSEAGNISPHAKAVHKVDHRYVLICEFYHLI